MMRTQITFDIVLEEVRSWLNERRTAPFSNIGMTILKDEPAIIHTIFETKRCIVELIVTNPDSAPYRWVSFQVLNAEASAKAPPLFRYYDAHGDTVTEVVEQLNRGWRICEEHT